MMDLMYASVIGIGLSKVNAALLDAHFFVYLLLAATIFEDLYLYYNDANVDGGLHPDAKASWRKFIDLPLGVAEIAILAAWLFAIIAFSDISQNFFIFFGVFLGLKTVAGFFLCWRDANLKSFHMLQELVFLCGASVSLFIGFLPKAIFAEYDYIDAVAFVLVVWALQTVLWWSMQKYYALSYKPPKDPKPGM